MSDICKFSCWIYIFVNLSHISFFVIVTVISAVIMFALFLSEFNYYLSKEIVQELFVDTSKGQKIKINIDVTFPRMGCACK